MTVMMQIEDLESSIKYAMNSSYQHYFDANLHSLQGSDVWFPYAKIQYSVEEVPSDSEGGVVIGIAGSTIQERIQGYCKDEDGNTIDSIILRIEKKLVVRCVMDTLYIWNTEEISAHQVVDRTYSLFMTLVNSKITEQAANGIYRPRVTMVSQDVSTQTNGLVSGDIMFTVFTSYIKE